MDKKQKMILGGLVIAGLAYYLYQQSKKPKASTESTTTPAPKSFAGNVGNREK